MIWKAHAVVISASLRGIEIVKTEGFSRSQVVTKSQHCKQGNISERLEDSDVVTTDHWYEVMHGLFDCVTPDHIACAYCRPRKMRVDEISTDTAHRAVSLW